MIGRGSRFLKDKPEFNVIDLGNNARRFDFDAHINWQQIFRAPQAFIDGLYSDEEIENEFVYQIPEDLAKRFEGGPEIEFDMMKVYNDVMKAAERPKKAVDISLEQHKKLIKYAADDYWDAVELIDLLGDDNFRVKQYSKCMARLLIIQVLAARGVQEGLRLIRHSFNDED